LPLPPRGSGGSRSSDVPVASGKADAGKPEDQTPSAPLSVPGVQRALESHNATAARAVPTSAGPVVLRVVPSAAGESSPETWQRLTSMPVVAPIPTRYLGSQPAGGVHPEVPAAGIAWSAVGENGAAAIANSTDFDSFSGAGFTPGDRAAPAADPSSIAVGRSIQRTIALPAAGTAEGSAWQAAGPLSRMATDTASAAHAPAGPRPPSISLQRSGAFITATPGTTLPAASPWAPESVVAMPAPPGFPASPAESVIEARQATSPPLALSLVAASSPDRGQNQHVLQRDAEIATPDPAIAVPAPPASPTSVAEEEDGGAAVSGPESAPPWPGQPGMTAKGAAAGAATPGSAAQASPEQLEELAKRLAGPLIRRIKAEMLLDRERRGLRTDVN
jgi:hypothetical protein